MLTHVRAACAATLALTLTAAVAVAGTQKSAGPVPGEDDFRSVTGYTVALMEHCKAANKLARNKGSFNATLAREHAAEIARAAEAATRHAKSYQMALGPEQRTLVADPGGVQGQATAAMTRLAGALDQATKSPSPDRKLVAETVTELFLVAKDFLAAHKAAGKALRIGAATPPRKSVPKPPRAPRKPKASAETAMAE